MKSRHWIQKAGNLSEWRQCTHCSGCCLGSPETRLLKRKSKCLWGSRELTKRHAQMQWESKLATRKYCRGSQLPYQEPRLHIKRIHTDPPRAKRDCFLTDPTSSEEEASAQEFPKSIDTAPLDVYAFCDHTAFRSPLNHISGSLWLTQTGPSRLKIFQILGLLQASLQ